MSHAPSAPVPRSLSEKILRAVIVGTLSMLAFYLKVLGVILRLGIRLVKGAPAPKHGRE